jgi:hypothetical protein
VSSSDSFRFETANGELVVYERQDGSIQINDKRSGSDHDMTVAITEAGGLTAYTMKRKRKP